MIDLTGLRAANYIHPATATDPGEADTSRYLRILSVDLVKREVTAKEDNNAEIHIYTAAQIFGCNIEAIKQIVGGFSFNEHSVIIEGEAAVFIVHENGSSIALPHIRYMHEFQNLFRSLTGTEFPYNVKME